MDDQSLARFIAIGGGTLGAAWGIARELKRRRDQQARIAVLKEVPASEKESLEAVARFEARHRRYEAAVVAAIAGFGLLAVAALPDLGIVSVIAIPLILGGFIVGIESYKCPRCDEPPVKSWKLGTPTYPARCGQCGAVLRRGEEP